MKISLSFKAFIAVLSIQMSSAVMASSSRIVDGKTLVEVNSQAITLGLAPGSVLFLGEIHGSQEVSDGQMQLIHQLKEEGRKVSVGLEFLEYTNQPAVDFFREGKIFEHDFLDQVKWGSFPFDLYRRQILFPDLLNERTIALNAPRWLSSKIAKFGLESLTKEDLVYLPPHFELGRSSYRKRFEKIMGGHIPAASMDKYFTAQSLWDDTMAWKTAEFLQAHPDQVLVVVVGEFHTQYGGGFPNRLAHRLGLAKHQIRTLSFVSLAGLDQTEIEAELSPNSSDGPRADYIWLISF